MGPARAKEQSVCATDNDVGLCQHRFLFLAARGGQYAGTEFDSQTPHLKTMLGLMGISDVEVVFAEGLNMGDAHRDAALKEAFQAIDQLVEAL